MMSKLHMLLLHGALYMNGIELVQSQGRIKILGGPKLGTVMGPTISYHRLPALRFV